MRPSFNGIPLTEESMQATRQWFAETSRKCIEDARTGVTRVNDLERYCAWREQCAEDSLAGKGDHTLAFLQRAYFIQTGECVALLP